MEKLQGCAWHQPQEEGVKGRTGPASPSSLPPHVQQAPRTGPTQMEAAGRRGQRGSPSRPASRPPPVGKGTEEPWATAQLCSCFPSCPHVVQVEMRHSTTPMEIQGIYCPPGVSGVTEPPTQLHGLLSPSRSSFPKGSHTWPTAPPAAAVALNLQLPGADRGPQKPADFSRERGGK